MSQRTERVDELLRQEISEILRRDVDDPRIGFATITDVETSPDLRSARVWVSVIGQPAEREETLAALRRAMPFVRRALGRLRLRRIPELHVRMDDSAERGTRVLRLLEELESGAVPDGLPEVAESLPTPDSPAGREDEAEEAPEPSRPRRSGPRARRSDGRTASARGRKGGRR